jgi:signal transduction histidine kinase
MAVTAVLVIDDSPTDMALQAEALRPEHQVLCATNPEAAFELIRSGARPDLVVLDVMMPGADGLSVCRRLKADAATAAVPVIFVTARDGVEDEEAGFSAGGVDYVAKPVNPHLLRARVRTHIELKQARESLERQNEALREAAKLREEVEHINRHDLKNPLMVILNIPDLLKRQANITADQKKWLEMIEGAARKMLEMINRSIDLLKMEKGIYPLQPVDVDALAVARQIVSAVTPLAVDRGVKVDLLLDGRPAAESDTFGLRSEELLLYSMLSNLAKNAVEASPPGATASISLRDGGAAIIDIHNEGAIPASIRKRFFEKFATAGKKGGTGLGAYSARLIATTLGGTIAHTSSERDGTTVTVTLPRRFE